MSGYYPSSGYSMSSSSQPDFAAALSKIRGMSNTEMQEILDREEKAEQFVKGLDQVRN